MMETKPAEETAQTLRKSPGGENGVVQSIGFKAGQSKDGGLGDEREVSPTLSHQPSALEPTLAQSQFGDVAGCLTHRTDSSPCADRGQNVVATCKDLSQMRYIVRRLTPTECERLMGLPDGYTIPAGLDANDPALVAEFQRIFDEFGAIMAAYEGGKPPKPKTAAQVQKWLAKITDPATCPDSPRYKGCGNGWATNQPRWILTRLLNVEDIEW
jgi:DNA (cytosine-5)-methyltransferase 1